MASNLAAFGLAEMLRCGSGVRRAGASAPTLQDSLARICRFLHEELQGPNGERACALVRAYKTHPFDGLSDEDRAFALQLMGNMKPPAGMRCLTLVATVGDKPEWNDRMASRGHRAIPLPRPDIVTQAPMIAQLIRQFGLDIGTVLKPSPDLVRDLEGKTYGVFHVENAEGSPYIPAQDEFVKPNGIHSVVGFGGSLRGAELFAVIMFSRVPIAADVAERFRTVALDVKSVLFPYDDDRVFARRS